MLNEMMAIADQVEKMGIRTDSFHHNIISSPCRNNTKVPKFKVFISEDGVVSNVELINSKTWATYFYCYKNAHNSFPITRISNPYNIDSTDASLSIKKSEADKLYRRCSRGKKTAITYLVENIERNEYTEAFFIIAERISKINEPLEFFTSIISKAINLLPKTSKCKGAILKKHVLNCMYITFEVDGYERMGIYPLNHRETFKAISDSLKKKENKYNQEEGGNTLDIFGKRFSVSAAHCFPQLSIGGNKFYVYSNNPNVPCFKRYGVNGGDALPLSFFSRSKIINNMQYLFRDKNERTFWTLHTKKDGSKIATLVFSPLDDNSMKNLQKIIINDGDDVSLEIGDAEEKIDGNSSKVIDAICGYESCKKNDIFHIISFRIPKNSQGASKLLLSKMFSVKELMELAKKWVEGWKYFSYSSTFYSSIFVRKNEKVALKKCIGISEMLKIINKKWTRSAGVRGNKVIKSGDIEHEFMGMEHVINIFCGDKTFINEAIRIIAFNHIYLMLDLVNRMHNNQLYHLIGPRNDIFSLPVVCGELLYQNDISKETYENNPVYQVGKILSCISKVQKEVLKNEKRKSFSGDFIGTRYIHLALSKPIDALNISLKKALVYLIKAKQDRLVRYALKDPEYSYYPYWQIMESFKILQKKDLPSKMTAIDRVILALGYFQNR